MIRPEVLLWSAYILGGYLLGGVLFARLVPRAVRHVDICALSADGNPGVFNVFSCCGKPLGILCLVLELSKGFLPVWLACRHLFVASPLFALVIAAPVLGHATAPFDRDIPGGKAISATFGSLLGLIPICSAVYLLAALYIGLSTVVRIPSHRRRSILTFVLFGALAGGRLLLRGQVSFALGCIAIAAVVTVRHLRSPEDPVPETRAAV